MNIGSFTFPANDNEADNVLNSGIDLQFSVMKACKNKEAAYEVLEYLYSDEKFRHIWMTRAELPARMEISQYRIH